jgi:hypothetical protein
MSSSRHSTSRAICSVYGDRPHGRFARWKIESWLKERTRDRDQGTSTIYHRRATSSDATSATATSTTAIHHQMLRQHLPSSRQRQQKKHTRNSTSDYVTSLQDQHSPEGWRRTFIILAGSESRMQLHATACNCVNKRLMQLRERSND